MRFAPDLTPERQGPWWMAAGLLTALRRGVVVGTAYLSTALATVAVIFAMRHIGATGRLGQVLGVQFMATLAAGLEPATSRALAIGRGAQALDPPALKPIALASAIKAIVTAGGLALVWRLADPTADGALLALTPGLCLAGFLATDARAFLDLQGRHAEAIWLKQGSLALGLIVMAALFTVGVPLAAALGVAVAVRIALAAAVYLIGSLGTTTDALGEAQALLSDPRWLNLAGASVLAAIGGSADRVFGLRFLAPQAWSSYYLVYEILSKAWFLPYLLAPILFARAAGGKDGGLNPRLAWGLVLASGVGLVAIVVAAVVLAPGPLSALIGSALPRSALIAFAVAVAMNSLVQLRLAELQGDGRIVRAFVAVALTAAVAIALFYWAASRGYGAAGLLYAWLAKAAVELAAVYLPVPRSRGAAAPA